MFNNLIDNIYVINLKSCKDRKEHIINEFKRVGINKYEFFEAIDKNSDEVKNLMKTKFVMKYPPCFRCRKIKCNCNNNVLVKSQIGNWCSYIKIMKKIVDNNYKKLIMICEDDIKFTNRGKNILNKIINIQNFKKYNINFNKPVLIRAGSALNKNHTLRIQNPIMNKQKIMSNPCFFINIHYAISFLKNLNFLDRTSDMYIHGNILNKDKSIQHFTIFPQPIYELSYGKNAIFKSEIHPKNNGLTDKSTYNNHIKKLIYKDILCIGHPRSGTSTICDYLNQIGYNIKHENIGPNGVSSWMLAVDDKNYPWGNIKNINRFYFNKIVHIVRNPFDAIPSIILENKYSPNNISYKFRKKHIKNILNIDLPNIDINKISLKEDIDIAIKTYIYWNKICELKKPDLVCKIKDTNSLKPLNYRNKNIVYRRKNKNKLYNKKRYTKPKISLDMYNNIDDELKHELKSFCKKYNYKYLLDNVNTSIDVTTNNNDNN